MVPARKGRKKGKTAERPKQKVLTDLWSCNTAFNRRDETGHYPDSPQSIFLLTVIFGVGLLWCFIFFTNCLSFRGVVTLDLRVLDNFTPHADNVETMLIIHLFGALANSSPKQEAVIRDRSTCTKRGCLGDLRVVLVGIVVMRAQRERE